MYPIWVKTTTPSLSCSHMSRLCLYLRRNGDACIFMFSGDFIARVAVASGSVFIEIYISNISLYGRVAPCSLPRRFDIIGRKRVSIAYKTGIPHRSGTIRHYIEPPVTTEETKQNSPPSQTIPGTIVSIVALCQQRVKPTPGANVNVFV